MGSALTFVVCKKYGRNGSDRDVLNLLPQRLGADPIGFPAADHGIDAPDSSRICGAKAIFHGCLRGWIMKAAGTRASSPRLLSRLARQLAWLRSNRFARDKPGVSGLAAGSLASARRQPAVPMAQSRPSAVGKPWGQAWRYG